MKIVNDISREISVKKIRLHIKTKSKFRDNLGHKEHNTHYLHSHSLFVNLPKILKPFPNHHLHTSTSSHMHTDKCDKKEEICIGSNLSAVE